MGCEASRCDSNRDEYSRHASLVAGSCDPAVCAYVPRPLRLLLRRSIEWVTDASSVIVVGELVKYGDDQVQVRVDDVLKECAGQNVNQGQVLEGVHLGRSGIFEENRGLGGRRVAISSRGLGMPVYSEPSTYPGRHQPISARELAVIRNMGPRNHWTVGNRVVLFLGPDIQQTVQAINLGEPVRADPSGPPFLAVDVHGKAIVASKDLLDRVRKHVAEGRRTTQDGAPKVCPHGFYYKPRRGTEIDGEDYHLVFVPPGPMFGDSYRTFMAEPGSLGGLRAKMMLLIGYWFYSDKTLQDYREDRQKDFEEVLGMVRSQHLQGLDNSGSARMRCRICPAEWKCVLSENGDFFAYIDGDVVSLYGVEAGIPNATRPLLRVKAVDIRTSEVAFSPNSRYFAYTTANGVVVYDVYARSDISNGELTKERPGRGSCAKLQFSDDGKYLAQVVQRGRMDPNTASWVLDRGMTVYVWGVAKGECLLEPYDRWQDNVTLIGFHTEKSRLIRVRAGRDRIWDIETGEVVSERVSDLWQSTVQDTNRTMLQPYRSLGQRTEEKPLERRLER